MINQRSQFNTWLALAIAVLSTGLLLWHTFRPVHQATVTVNETVFQRGEVIDSQEHFLRFTYVDTMIAMDTNTRVKLIDGSGTQPVVQVLEGRIVSKGPIEIRTRGVVTTSQDQLSYVHYSWLDRVDIAVFGRALVTFSETTLDLQNQALRIETLPPYITTPIDFQPEQSSAADFYQFVDGKKEN